MFPPEGIENKSGGSYPLPDKIDTVVEISIK